MEGIREKFLWRKAFLSKVVGYNCHFKKKNLSISTFLEFLEYWKFREATFFFFYYGRYFMRLSIHAELEQLDFVNKSIWLLFDGPRSTVISLMF